MAAAMIGAQPVRKYRPEAALRTKAPEAAPDAEVTLPAGQFWRAGGSNCWRAILCREGLMWITQDGDLRDHLIMAGEMFLISQPGKVIAQALVNSRIEVTPCLATAAFPAGVEERVFP